MSILMNFELILSHVNKDFQLDCENFIIEQ